MQTFNFYSDSSFLSFESDRCSLGFIQLLLFIVELQGNKEGREKGKRVRQTGQGNWLGLRISLLRVGSVCGILHLSFCLHFCWINQRPSPSLPLIWSFLYQGCVFLSLQSSLLSLSLQPTLSFYPQHSVPQKREDAAFSGCRGFTVAQTHVLAADVQPEVAGFGLLKRAQCCHPPSEGELVQPNILWCGLSLPYYLYLPNLWCFGNVSSGTGKAN